MEACNQYTNKEALGFLSKYMYQRFHDLAEAYHFRFLLMNACMSVPKDYPYPIPAPFCGYTAVAYDGQGAYIQTVVVGLPDELVLPAERENTVLSENVISIMIAVNREYIHVLQALSDRTKNTEFGQVICADMNAQLASPLYHDRNYMLSPSEIDAQCVAIYMAYQDLCDLTDEDTAVQCICAYQNRRMADAKEGVVELAKDKSFVTRSDSMCDFVGNADSDYTDVNHIFEDFNSAFVYAAHCHKEYCLPAGIENQEPFALKCSQVPQLWSRFRCEKDGFLQDMLLSSFSAHVLSRLDYYKETVGLDFSRAEVVRPSAIVRALRPRKKYGGMSSESCEESQDETADSGESVIEEEEIEELAEDYEELDES